jgi:hypothetical protein
MPASVTDSLDALRGNVSKAASGHDRLVQGCFRTCAEFHAPTHGGTSRLRSRRRLWIPNLCSRGRFPREGSEGSRASMCQALVVKLRWSLVFGPCSCCERLSGEDMDHHGWKQEAMLLSQPRYAGSWRVPGHPGMCIAGFGPSLSA